MPLHQIGIDLGTTRIRVYRPRKGIQFSEPTCAAFDLRRDGEPVAYGEAARRMVGREPDFIRVIFPMLNGVIADYRVCEHLLRRVLEQVCGARLIKPAVALCMPAGVTGVEQYALENAAMEAGARRFLLVEEPVAAALGAGLDITKPHGRLVVDIGGGSTDACVLSMYHTIARSSCRVAGNALDDAIQRYLRNQRNFLIGPQTAERIKMEHGAAADPDPDDVFEVKGRLANGAPGRIQVRQAELTEAMRETLLAITDGIRGALESTPPDLAADIAADGMCLTGGCALLRNIDKFFGEVLGLPVRIPEDPQNCAAIGTGLAFRYARKRKRAEAARLRMRPKQQGIPESGLRRADECEPPFRTRPDWFVRDEDERPVWHGVPLPESDPDAASSGSGEVSPADESTHSGGGRGTEAEAGETAPGMAGGGAPTVAGLFAEAEVGKADSEGTEGAGKAYGGVSPGRPRPGMAGYTPGQRRKRRRQGGAGGNA